MRIAKDKQLINKLAAGVMSVLTLLCLCSCKKEISSQEEIISFAKNNFGDCEVVSVEEDKSGKKNFRTVYFKDKDTGISYSVKSYMGKISIDLSNGPSSACTYTDFSTPYFDYVMDPAKKDIDEVYAKYGLRGEERLSPGVGSDQIRCYIDVFIYSERNVEESTAVSLCEEFEDVLRKYDIKGLFNTNFYFRSDDEIEIGTMSYNYDPETKSIQRGKYKPTYIYETIDHIQKNYDESLVFATHYADKYEVSDIYLNKLTIKSAFPFTTPNDKLRRYLFEDPDGSLIYVFALYEEEAPKKYFIFEKVEGRVYQQIGQC